MMRSVATQADDVAAVDRATGVGDPVVLAAAALRLVAPVGLDEAVLLEAAVGRVQRRFLDLVVAAGGIADRLVDLEAVPVAAAQHAEHDRVGVPAQQIGCERVVLCHGKYCITSSTCSRKCMRIACVIPVADDGRMPRPAA